MKTRSLSTKLIFVFLFLAVALYFGVQAYRYLVNPQTTTLVYAYASEETLSVNGWFVRDEQVVPCDDTLLELERDEGERVSANGALATVYRSEAALADHRELRTLESKLEQLRYASEAAKDAETALKLDGDIREDIVSLRAALASGGYLAAEAAGGELRTSILKREYAYDGAEDLTARIESLRSELTSLKSRVEGGTKTVRAPFAGVYSAVADGYESVLTSAALETMTVAEYDAIAATGETSTVGCVIRGDRWYFVTTLPAADAARLAKGQSLLLRPATGVDFDLDVTVSRVGREENGRAVVVLSSDEHLAYVTLLRAQKAELILKSYSGLRIPKNALRVNESGASGVYCRIGLRAYFKAVEVIWQGEDYCLVTPVPPESGSDSTRQLYTLRAGDEVIISANDLYDGKVIE